MMPVGTYVSNGQTLTWAQPPEGVEPVPPYTPTPAASSNCVPYKSEDLFAAIASVSAGASGSTSSSVPAITSTDAQGHTTVVVPSVASITSTGAQGQTTVVVVTNTPSSTADAGADTTSGTGSGTADAPSNTNSGARAMGISVIAGVSGVLLSVLVFA